MLLSMNIVIAHATVADAAYFASALAGHELDYMDGAPTSRREDARALAVVHGKPAGAETFDLFPNLGLVVTRSTGYDHIDLAAARERGIAVCNVPEYGSTTVAEFTFGLMLSLARHIPQAVSRCREGRFSVEGLMGADLEGKTLGIVGLGKIGRSLARMAEGFSMRAVAHDPYKPDSIPLDDLLTQSDIVALCCPLTPETHHLIDAQALARMKPQAMLVNTARGGVVDAQALLDALDGDRLAGAALDVLEDEGCPGELSQRLMRHPKALVTPHLAFDSVEALQRIRETTAEVLRAFAEGRIVNAVP
jgi:D-lactate dehydrogenase